MGDKELFSTHGPGGSKVNTTTKADLPVRGKRLTFKEDPTLKGIFRRV